MSTTSVVLNPQQEMGFATFMEDPNTGASIVAVMTKRYVQRILATGNLMLLDQLKKAGKDVTDLASRIPQDSNPEKVVKLNHEIFMFMGYKDRRPHSTEMVDYLYDFNEELFLKEGDASKSIITLPKRYNLHFGGTMLAPWYPDAIPVPPVPGLQGLKIPQLPGLPPLPSMPF